jgi:hypothetical protein
LLRLDATTVRRLSFDDLVSKSHTIVVGTTVNSNTFWTPDHKLILTSYTLEVQQSLKGTPQKTIVVTTIGGRVGNTILQMAGAPNFSNGETSVVFLEQSGGYNTVVGLNQGKFPIVNGAVSSPVGGVPQGMSLDEFKNQVQLRIGR